MGVTDHGTKKEGGDQMWVALKKAGRTALTIVCVPFMITGIVV